MAQITRSDTTTEVLSLATTEVVCDNPGEVIEQYLSVEAEDELLAVFEASPDCDVMAEFEGETLYNGVSYDFPAAQKPRILRIRIRSAGIVRIIGKLGALGSRIRVNIARFKRDIAEKLKKHLTPRNKCRICRRTLSIILRAIWLAHGAVIFDPKNFHILAQKMGVDQLLLALGDAVQQSIPRTLELLKWALEVVELDPFGWVSERACRLTGFCGIEA